MDSAGMYTGVVQFHKAPFRDSIGVSVAALVRASVGWDQHHDMKPPAEKPVVLYQGLGAWRHPVSTKNVEAQKSSIKASHCYTASIVHGSGIRTEGLGFRIRAGARIS